jgi:hypothetical protein
MYSILPTMKHFVVTAVLCAVASAAVAHPPVVQRDPNPPDALVVGRDDNPPAPAVTLLARKPDPSEGTPVLDPRDPQSVVITARNPDPSEGTPVIDPRDPQSIVIIARNPDPSDTVNT